MEVIPVVYMLKCVILAKYNSCDQTLACILSGKPTDIECCGRACPSQLPRGTRDHPAPVWFLQMFSAALSLYQQIQRRNGLSCTFYSVYYSAFLINC